MEPQVEQLRRFASEKIKEFKYGDYVSACGDIFAKGGRYLSPQVNLVFDERDNCCYVVSGENRIPICPVQPCEADIHVETGCVEHGRALKISVDSKRPDSSVFNEPPAIWSFVCGVYDRAEMEAVLKDMTVVYKTGDLDELRQRVGRCSHVDAARKVIVSVPRLFSHSWCVTDYSGLVSFYTCAAAGCREEGIHMRGDDWYCSRDCEEAHFLEPEKIDIKSSAKIAADLRRYFDSRIQRVMADGGISRSDAVKHIIHELCKAGETGLRVTQNGRKYYLMMSSAGVLNLLSWSNSKRSTHGVCSNLSCLAIVKKPPLCKECSHSANVYMMSEEKLKELYNSGRGTFIEDQNVSRK